MEKGGYEDNIAAIVEEMEVKKHVPEYLWLTSLGFKEKSKLKGAKK